MDLGEARNARGQDAESMSEDMARWRAELGEDFEQPERKGLDDLTEGEEAAVEWRTGKRPAYVLANHVFLEGKSQAVLLRSTSWRPVRRLLCVMSMPPASAP